MGARNLHAAAAALTSALGDLSARESVGLSEIINRATHHRDWAAMARVSTDEAREIVELVLMGATLPAGAAGEAALAYLMAQRQGLAPVPAACARLEAQGGDDGDFDALEGWLRALAEHCLRSAASGEAHMAIRKASHA